MVDGGLILGLLAASAVSAAGSIYANRQNRKAQQSANEQMIELADTAHQREVADLVAAGLNPILSATGNGASVPSLGVASQDNVLSSFGRNASSIGEALSSSRSLANDSLAIDNDLQSMDAELRHATFDATLNSARHEIARDESLAMFGEDLAMARQKALYDYMYGKDGWHVEPGENGGTRIVPDKPARKPFMKDVRDSVKAEVKHAGTQYLQGWSNNIRGWVDTGIDAFNAAASFRRGGAMIKHQSEKLMQDDFFRSREDVRRQERHDAWKFGGRRK